MERLLLVLAALLRAEAAKYAQVMKASGARLDERGGRKTARHAHLHRAYGRRALLRNSAFYCGNASAGCDAAGDVCG